MTVNSAEIIVGAPDRTTGAIMVAPTGTALPADTATAPNAAFLDLGYITEDGVSLSQSSSWETIRDWGGDQVRKFLSDFTGTLNFGLLQTAPEGMRFAYGEDNVLVTPATASTGTRMAIRLNATEPPERSLIVNVLDGVRRVRIVVPRAQVTERADLTFSRTGAVIHNFTVETSPDAAGDSVRIYTDDGVFAAA